MTSSPIDERLVPVYHYSLIGYSQAMTSSPIDERLVPVYYYSLIGYSEVMISSPIEWPSSSLLNQ